MEDGSIKEGAFLTCRDWHQPEPAYLDTRGWTFQEKYLSPRTLGFSKTEMYWTCASKTASEGLPMGLIPFNNKSDFDRLHWWYQTMEIYSYRMFTRESDRIIALAGLASKFQTPGDEFLYGLWKSDLAHGLAWRLSDQNKETARDISLTLPIPCWSWASRSGGLITYSDYERDGAVIDCNGSVISISFSGDGLSVTFFEVLSVGPMPVATNLAALYTRPSIKLRGLVLRIIPTKSCAAYSETVFLTHQSFILFRYAFSSKIGTYEQFFGNAFYDEPVTKGDNLYCVPLTFSSSEDKDAKRKTREPFEGYSIDKLASIQNLVLSIGGRGLPGMTWCAGPISCRRMEENDSFCCLMLKEIDAGVKFRRVGYLEIHNNGRSFDEAPPTTIEII